MWRYFLAGTVLTQTIGLTSPSRTSCEPLRVEKKISSISVDEVVRRGRHLIGREIVEVRFEVGSIMSVPTLLSTGVRTNVSHLVPKRDKVEFTAYISGDLEESLGQIGIHDLSDHFVGKTVTIRGYVSRTATEPILSQTSWTYHVALRSVENLLSVVTETNSAIQADTENKSVAIKSLAGKWRPIRHSLPQLDVALRNRGKAGFEINIDKCLGDSHRKVSGGDSYFQKYAEMLDDRGHRPIATGYINFAYSSEGSFIATEKGGSTYLWYGIVAGGSPRIFLCSGSAGQSPDVLVIQWESTCVGFPGKSGTDSTTIIYQRNQ